MRACLKKMLFWPFFVGLLGTVQYGVHVNGYFTDQNGKLSMWVARRSPTKQTWPGKLDQIVRL